MIYLLWMNLFREVVLAIKPILLIDASALSHKELVSQKLCRTYLLCG
jgi:hypothetical protein